MVWLPGPVKDPQSTLKTGSATEGSLKPRRLTAAFAAAFEQRADASDIPSDAAPEGPLPGALGVAPEPSDASVSAKSTTVRTRELVMRRPVLMRQPRS